MKNIYWKKLSLREKVIWVLGWWWILNAIYWIAFIITYAVGRDRGKEFKHFFNPHTFKVPYVFGWISVILLIVMVVFMGLILILGLFFFRSLFHF